MTRLRIREGLKKKITTAQMALINAPGSTTCTDPLDREQLSDSLDHSALPARRLLAKSAALNLFGEALPLLAGLFCMPHVVHGLGAERFGLLSIAWLLLGYFSLVDLGLGRATTKFAAETLACGRYVQLNELINTSLAIQFGLGILGGLVLFLLSPIAIHKILNVSSVVESEAKITLMLLAAVLPFILLMNTLRGVLEAAQRFDLINWAKIPSNCALFIVPALLATSHVGLPIIVFAMVLVRISTATLYFFLCKRGLSAWHPAVVLNGRELSRLLKFGGWVTTTNLVGPILMYMDRFFIGSFLTVAAVGFYTAPAELVTRTLVVPVSVVGALFPAFSAMESSGATEEIRSLYGRALKHLLIILAPPLLLISVFANDILRFWLGVDFALRSTRVLQVLAIAVLLNALAYIPYVILQGIGRPDIPACFHLLELPIYAVLLIVLVAHFGLIGAAFAWASRVLLDAICLFIAVPRLGLSPLAELESAKFTRCAFGILIFVGTMFLLRAMNFNLPFLIASSLCALLAFLLVVWNYLLDGYDRGLIVSTLRRLRVAV